ncbi:hypothetical protein G9A89_002576 [Geosiphon pyriformis]|nr:hypothetical protein G9A89_002576 [Geosiphon pyriformis]
MNEKNNRDPLIGKIKRGWRLIAGYWHSVTNLIFKPAEPKTYLLTHEDSIQFLSEMARYAQLPYRENRRRSLIMPEVWGIIDGVQDPLKPAFMSRPFIIVTFRGRSLDHATMLSLAQTRELILYPDGISDEPLLVNNEFYHKRFAKVKEKILESLGFWVANIYKRHFFAFTGHGEGAVFAVFSALALRIRKPRLRIFVVTFGEPRIGNQAFARFVNKRLEVWRVTYADDYVPLFFRDHAHEMMEFWIPRKSNCDCVDIDPKKISETVYVCQGMRFEGEHPDCINRFSRNIPEESSAHWGPYFGYIMAPNDDEVPYLT